MALLEFCASYFVHSCLNQTYTICEKVLKYIASNKTMNRNSDENRKRGKDWVKQA